MNTLDIKTVRRFTDKQANLLQEMLSGGGCKTWCVFGRIMTIIASVLLFKLTVLNPNASTTEVISGSLLSVHLMFSKFVIAIFTLLKYRLSHGKEAIEKIKEFAESLKSNK